MDRASKFLLIPSFVLVLAYMPAASASSLPLAKVFATEAPPLDLSIDRETTTQAVNAFAFDLTATPRAASTEALLASETSAAEPPSLAIFGASVIFAAGLVRRRVTH